MPVFSIFPYHLWWPGAHAVPILGSIDFFVLWAGSRRKNFLVRIQKIQMRVVRVPRIPKKNQVCSVKEANL